MKMAGMYHAESHAIDLRRNELQWFLYAAWGETLGIPCI